MPRHRTYIHEREGWTNFRWDLTQLQNIMCEVNREAGYLAGRLNAIGIDAQLRTATETLANDIVASSAIEGIVLDTDEVRSSVARKLGVQIHNEKASTHHVDGIVEMMLDATVNYSRPLTDERLFSWHRSLFPTGYSGMERINVGMYRIDPMRVVSGMFGREKEHYRAPEAERVQKEMEQLLAWHNNEKASYIKSAIAHLWFVCIHPFDDGNGRIARAISDMVLAQTECNGRRFYSLSAQINKEKSAYNEILERTQLGNGDITEWLKWYLTCLRAAIRSSYSVLSNVLRKSMFWRTHQNVTLSERQRTVLNTYLDGYEAKLTIKNYAKLCKISPDTAGRDIHDLEAKGMLRMNKGKVRDASYSIIFTDDAKQYGDLELSEQDALHYITAKLPDGRIIREDITGIDYLRFSQDELTLEDLADKYFSFVAL